MNATNFQTEIEHGGQVYDVHIEVDVHVSRGGFDYGFGGQRQTETEVTVEVTDFGVRDEAGNEIEDKAIRAALSPLVDEVAELETERLAERVAA
jgi:hypothetical protein